MGRRRRLQTTLTTSEAIPCPAAMCWARTRVGLARLIKSGLDWRKTGEGRFASPMAEGWAFLNSDPRLARPNLQLHFVVGIVGRHLSRILANGGAFVFSSACPMAGPQALTFRWISGRTDRRIRARADTVYHPLGTCKKGSDPMAVTDNRVLDASARPRPVGVKTNSPGS